jgi:hypothetical protein
VINSSLDELLVEDRFSSGGKTGSNGKLKEKKDIFNKPL